MKQLYPKLALVLFLLTLITGKGWAQCPAGYVPDEVGFDTTITFTDGTLSTDIKFPKFDPSVGMVTCVRLTMTVSSTLNFMYFENRDNTVNTSEVIFSRSDVMTGPGLSSAISNSESHQYGPYTLQPKDAIPNSGPDYIGVGPEEIFNKTIVRTITNAADISQFYGAAGDSLTYHYSASGNTQNNTTGNWFGGIDAMGQVEYKLEFCYCPAFILPLNVKLFDVTKVEDDRATLKWNGFDEEDVNYNYEVQVSNDGINFKTISVATKKNSAQQNEYNFTFTAANSDKHTYYFRIRQVYGNGYSRFSDTRTLQLEGNTAPKFNLYPNPSSGIVGIKFDNVSAGKYFIQITNAQGQVVKSQHVQLAGNTYKELGQLNRGIYWIKVTDVESTHSGVHQLMIK